MNKQMALKLPNLPCFEAFGVIFCPDVCSYFFLVCGGGGHQRISEYRERTVGPKFLRTELLSRTSARDVRATMLAFPGLGKPDRNF